MRIYPQFILWTYVLLPTICLLLSPTFLLGIAKAQQQRAKLMANALNARAKTAANLARNQAKNQQRRLLPNRFSSGFNQKPFKLRTTRDVKIPTMMDPNADSNMFERKTHWDQQEESLNQLQNMWNMNDFGNTHNTMVLRNVPIDGADDVEHPNFEQKSSNADAHHKPKKYQKKCGKYGCHYQHGEYGGHHPKFSEDGEEVLELDESMLPSDMEQPNFEQKSSNADAHHKPKKYHKKCGKYGCHYNHGEYEGHRHRSSEDGEETVDLDESMLPSDIEIPHFEQKSSSADAHHKPKKYHKKYQKKCGKYGCHYKQGEYGGHHDRSSKDGEEIVDFDESVFPRPEEIIGSRRISSNNSNVDRNVLYRGAFFGQNIYDNFLTQENPFSNEPNQNEVIPPVESLTNPNLQSEAPQTSKVEGETMISGERLANPEPTFKKKKKFGKKMEPNYYYYPQNYYNSYYAAPSYARNNDEDFQFEAPQITEFEEEMNGENIPPEERSANPEPTFKKKKEMEPNYYYPQNYYSSYYSFPPYARNNDEDFNFEIPQEPELEREIMDEESSFAERLANPEPTLNKKKKFEKKMEPSYYYPQAYYSSYYANPYYARTNDEEPPSVASQKLKFEDGIIGCELDDKIFSKNYGEGGLNSQLNPYSYHQRAAEVSELNKNSDSTKSNVHPPEQQSHVDYINSQETHDSNVGSIKHKKQETQSKTKSKSANPHSHGYTHSHTHFYSHQKNKGLHSNPVHYGPPIYQQPNGFSNNAEAFTNAQTYNHGGVQNSFTHTNSKGISQGYVPTSGFEQAGAHANAQTYSTSGVSATGFGHPTTQFGLSGAQAAAHANAGTNTGFNGNTFPLAHASAQAGSQTFNRGLGQSSSQAAAQASSSVHGNQQFFQVLGPSNFVGARSDDGVIGQPREKSELVISQQIPVNELLQNHEAEIERFPRNHDVLGGLNLASHIVQSSLDKNPQKIQNQKTIPNDEFANTQKTMRFVTDIVDSGLKAEKTINQNDDDAALKQPKVSINNNVKFGESFDSLEASRDSTFQGISSITDIINKSLRNRREIVDVGNNANHEQSDTDFETDNLDTNVQKLVDDQTLGKQELDNILSTNNETEEQSNDHGTKHVKKTLLDNVENIDNDLDTANVTDSTNEKNWDASLQSKTNSKALEPSIVPSNEPIKSDNEMIDQNGSVITEHITTIEPWAPNWNDVHNIDHPQNKSESSKPEKRFEQPDNLETTVDIKTLNDNIEHNLSLKEEQATNTVQALTEKTYLNATNVTAGETSHEPRLLHVINDENNANTTIKKENIHLFDQKPWINSSNEIKGTPKFDNVADEEILTPGDPITKNDSESRESSEEQGKNNGTRENSLSQIPILKELRNNVSTLTLDEIENIQFAIPDNTGTENTVLDINKQNNDNEEIAKKALLDNGQQNTQIQTKTEIQPEKDLNKTEEDKVQDSDRVDQFTLLGSPQNQSKRVFNISGGPFDSIEAEMSALTDQEKEAFIKQEMDLIAEVIHETLKNKDYLEKNRQQPKKTQDSTEKQAKDEAVVSSPSLFRVPDKDRNQEEFLRRARSSSATEFDAILGAHKEKLDDIQKEATNDGDLLMISFIGDSVVKDLEARRNKAIEMEEIGTKPVEMSPKRMTRAVKGFNPDRVPITRLISDPTTKIDVPKTLENVGAVVRHTFENSRAPIYHIRNMLGNTKNTLMSVAKVPPNNVLIPSRYEVAEISANKDDGERVGAINQKMLMSRSGIDNVAKKQEEMATEEPLEIMDAFQKIGEAVKGSVNSGKNVVMHMNDAATDARNVLYTAKHAAPRLIVPGQVPVISSRSNMDTNPLGKKAVLITPRLLDVQENIVGAQEKLPEQFVGMGHILDSVGFTKPNQPEVELEKIILEPSAIDVMKQWDMPKELRSSNTRETWMKDNLKREKNKETNILGLQENNVEETLGSLRKAEQSMGANNLKELFGKMHQEMKQILKSQHEERKKKRKEKYKTKSKAKKEYKLKKNKPIRKTVVSPIEQPIQKPDILGDAANTKINYDKIIDEHTDVTLPPEILHLFMEDNASFTPNYINSKMGLTKTESVKQTNPIDSKNADLGSGNDEKIINEKETMAPTVILPIQGPNPLASKNMQQLDTKAVAGKVHMQSDPTKNADEEVGIYLLPELMKPFMGEPSEDVLDNFMRENGDDVPSKSKSSENSKIPTHAPKIYQIRPLNLNVTIPIDKQSLQNFLYVGAATPKGYAEPLLNSNDSSNGGQSKSNDSDNTHLNSKPTRKTKIPTEKLDGLIDIYGEKHTTFSPETEKVFTYDDPNFKPLKRTQQFVPLTQLSSEQLEIQNVPANNGNQKDLLIVSNQDSGPHRNIENERKSSKIVNPFNESHLRDDLGHVLGAINPMMFERYFNESLRNNQSRLNTHNIQTDIVRSTNSLASENINDIKVHESNTPLEQIEIENDQTNGTGRTSMKIIKQYQKPFMGYLSHDTVHGFLKKYNNNLPESDETLEELVPQQIETNPVKNVVFSYEDEDYIFNI